MSDLFFCLCPADLDRGERIIRILRIHIIQSLIKLQSTLPTTHPLGSNLLMKLGLLHQQGVNTYARDSG